VYSYSDLVDIHGPVRNQAMGSFRLIPQLAPLADADLLAATWEAYRALIADRADLPHLRRGRLDVRPGIHRPGPPAEAAGPPRPHHRGRTEA
jgi:hypothetical protein